MHHWFFVQGVCCLIAVWCHLELDAAIKQWKMPICFLAGGVRPSALTKIHIKWPLSQTATEKIKHTHVITQKLTACYSQSCNLLLEDFIGTNRYISKYSESESMVNKTRRMGTLSRILSVKKVLVWLFFISLITMYYSRVHNSTP